MAQWSFFTNHAQVLVCIADDPGLRLRDIADRLGITERTAYGIVTDLVEGGYVTKDKAGRRNRYMVQAHLPLPAAVHGERTIGEVLELLLGREAREESRNTGAQAGSDVVSRRRARTESRDRQAPSAPTRRNGSRTTLGRVAGQDVT